MPGDIHSYPRVPDCSKFDVFPLPWGLLPVSWPSTGSFNEPVSLHVQQHHFVTKVPGEDILEIASTEEVKSRNMSDDLAPKGSQQDATLFLMPETVYNDMVATFPVNTRLSAWKPISVEGVIQEDGSVVLDVEAGKPYEFCPA